MVILRTVVAGILAAGWWIAPTAQAPPSSAPPSAATPSAATPSSATLKVAGRTSATPWIAADGTLVAVAWGATEGRQTDVYLAVSRDAGRHFGAPVRVNHEPGEAYLGGEFPPRVAVRRKRNGAGHDITVLWTAKTTMTSIKVARSADGGRTFSPATILQSRDAAGSRGWPALALDGSGTAHAIWLDHRGLAPKPGAPPATHTAHKTPADGVAMAQKSGLYYAAATGGTRSGPERSLAKGVCYCCKTALAAGPRGTVFAAWRHVYPGGLRDMAFAVSRNGGRTFGAPVRMHEDGWAINGCPDDGPAMAVDAAGTAHVIWPTVVQESQPAGALFYTSTRDGKVFTRRVRVPTLGGLRPTHPQIAIDASGRIVVAWEELRNGVRTAAVRELTHAGGAARFGSSLLLDGGPASYPVLAAAGKEFIAAWSAGEATTGTITVRPLRLPGS